MLDRDVKFISYFLKIVWRTFGPNMKFPLAFHPQIDGETKAINNILGCFLKSYVRKQQGY